MACANLQDKANGTRLSRLLVDKGTEAIRKTFDTIHPGSAKLATVLTKEKTRLQGLRPRIINNSQWNLLYPSTGNPNSNTFDVTLLTVLLRNICRLPAPTTGWDTMPPDTDRSLQGNVARIKLFRNEVYAHVTTTSVDDAQFEHLWQKISRALLDLTIPQSEIDQLKNCPLSPEEEIYVQLLNDWKIRDDECKDMLVTMSGKFEAFESFLKNYSQGSSRKVKGDEEIILQLAKHNFKGDVKRFVDSFQPNTRKWLFQRMDEWFKDKKSRVFILTAGPGVGKSVFAGKVCQVYEKKGKLAACHFCKFNDSNLRNPFNMLQSLASQMCTNVKGFKEKLVEHLKRPHQVNCLQDAFRLYLIEPLNDMRRKKPALIVIDGIDESEADGKSELLDVIAEEFTKLPEWVKVLVTSRPEIPVKKKLSHLTPLEILPDDQDNEFDLDQYLRFCLRELPGCKGTIISLLVKKCQGSFLFAFHIGCELRKRDNLRDLTVDELENFLPKEIGSVYQRYFDRLQNELEAIDKDLKVFNLLEILVAAKGSQLPLKFVTEVLGMSADCRTMKEVIRKVNDSLSNLLYVCNDLVAVFHKSVVDWLTSSGYDEHVYTVKYEDGNKFLWLACRKEFEEIKDNILGDLKLTSAMKYSLNHGFSYLVSAECCSEIDLEWLVDIVIIHAMLYYFPENVNLVKATWKQSTERGDSTLELRRKMSWLTSVLSSRIRFPLRLSTLGIILLQELVNNSFDYFHDEDKKTARFLLKKHVWCEMLINKSGKEEVDEHVSTVTEHPVSCSFSPDCSRLASCYADRTIRIWDVRTGCLVQRFPWHLVSNCFWSRGYLWTFLLEWGPTLFGIRVDQQLTINPSQGVEYHVDCDVEKVLTFSEGVLVLKCEDGSVAFVDILDEEFRPPMKFLASHPVECAAVSPGGSCVLTADLEAYQIWKRSGGERHHYPLMSWNRCMGCCISGDGMFGIITGGVLFGREHTVLSSTRCHIGHFNSGDILKTHQINPFGMDDEYTDVFVGATFFAILDRARRILVIYDIQSGEQLCMLTVDESFCLLAFSNKHNIVAISAKFGGFRFFKIHIPKY